MGYRHDDGEPIPADAFPSIYQCLQKAAKNRGLGGFDARWHQGRIILFGLRSDLGLMEMVQDFIENSFLTRNPRTGHHVGYRAWLPSDAPRCNTPNRYIYTVMVAHDGGFCLASYANEMRRWNPQLEGDWTMPPNTEPQPVIGTQGRRLWLVTLIVSQRDADYIESQGGSLRGIGLGVRHQFRRVNVIGSDKAAAGKPPPSGDGA